ncbi:hypothetical protein D3C72_1514410 [compost metagenome]
MPKSSIDSCTPSAFMSCSWLTASATSCMNRLSVSSSSRQAGGKPVSSSTSAIVATRFGSLNWRADRFTARRKVSSPAACQRFTCAHASRMTQAPIGTIRPVSSASAMKRCGATMPRSGCCQRSSASTPTMRPLAKSTCGW